MKKNKPKKLELFMTRTFASKKWNPWKLAFVLTEILFFIIGAWSTIALQFNKLNELAQFGSVFGTIAFAGLLVILAIVYYSAAFVKRFRFGKIAKELDCSIDDVNYWVEKHKITDEEIL
jgi:apolipoprotein N-acyltransferase